MGKEGKASAYIRESTKEYVRNEGLTKPSMDAKSSA